MASIEVNGKPGSRGTGHKPKAGDRQFTPVYIGSTADIASVQGEKRYGRRGRFAESPHVHAVLGKPSAVRA